MLQRVNDNNNKKHTPTYFYMIDIIWNWNLTIWLEALSLSHYSRHVESGHFKAPSCNFHTNIHTYTQKCIHTYIHTRAETFQFVCELNASLHNWSSGYLATNNTPSIQTTFWMQHGKGKSNWIWKMASSVTLRRVALVRTDVSEKLSACGCQL
jgi:hypothetical protein